MVKKLSAKNCFANVDTGLSKEELDKFAWKRNVLDAHIQTTLDARKIIEDSKTWRKRLERSCDEIREVANAWNNYEVRLKAALNNLSSRIEKYEKDQEENKVIEEDLTLKEDNKRREIAVSWVRGHFTKCTKLSEVRKRNKYVPDTTVHISRVR